MALTSAYCASLNKAGNTTLETHPALPEDRHRHKELKTMLSERFEMSRKQAFLKRGCFDGPVETVQWFPTDETGDGLITYSKLVPCEE